MNKLKSILFLLGANLRVCPIGMDQCCTQANENMLGMSLYRVLQNDSDNFTLGSEIYSMRQSAMELYNAMACKLTMMLIETKAKVTLGVLIMLRMVFGQ